MMRYYENKLINIIRIQNAIKSQYEIIILQLDIIPFKKILQTQSNNDLPQFFIGVDNLKCTFELQYMNELLELRAKCIMRNIKILRIIGKNNSRTNSKNRSELTK